MGGNDLRSLCVFVRREFRGFSARIRYVRIEKAHSKPQKATPDVRKEAYSEMRLQNSTYGFLHYQSQNHHQAKGEGAEKKVN
jgi:hypothetical protein